MIEQKFFFLFDIELCLAFPLRRCTSNCVSEKIVSSHLLKGWTSSECAHLSQRLHLLGKGIVYTEQSKDMIYS